MKDKGTLVVISGFSGAGKGTVSKALVEKFGYSLSVSATTRQPREGEQDGREYYFKSEDDFLRLIDYNGFIEYAQYVDHYYGTPRKFVEDELAGRSPYPSAVRHSAWRSQSCIGGDSCRTRFDDSLPAR